MTPSDAQRIERELRECSDRIGDMCAECRGPRMSIPVRQDDDDIFISNTMLAAADLIAKLRVDAARYAFIRDNVNNSLHLDRNDHAASYMPAEESINSAPEWFEETPLDEIERMKATDTIWSLQIYPDTPVGFYKWSGSTLDNVVDAALAANAPMRAEGT